MLRSLLAAAAFMLSSLALADGHMPQAYIVSPAEGATVDSPVTVVFGLKGYGVAPAGTMKEKTGHHHLVIDAPLPAMGEPIPANDHYRHFGHVL